MKRTFLLFASFLFSFSLLAQPGQPDSTFGTNGKVNLPFRPESYTPMAIQADGKIIIGGEKIARFNTDGSIDQSFGGGPVSAPDGFPFGAVALQGDGKIIAATLAMKNQRQVVGIYRYNQDGILDNSFGGTGGMITNLGWVGGERIVRDISIAIQADNKIIVAAEGAHRFNPDGSIDLLYFGPQFIIGSVAVQTDGKILFAGAEQSQNYGGPDFAIARYNSDGTVDNTFSDDGKDSIGFGVNDLPLAMIIQDDEKILLAGYTFSGHGGDGKFVLVRYNTDGTLDNSFNGDGKLTGTFNDNDDDAYVLTAVVQADGKIIVGGYTYNFSTGSFNAALARFNPGGTPDSSFGNNGIYVSPDNSLITTIALAGDKLYATGSSELGRYQLFSNSLPNVRITSPFNNQSITGPRDINITALANAPGGTITQVDFYNGNTLLASDDTAPYSFSWQNVGIGNYTLYAKASDNLGIVVVSPDVNISIVPDQAPIVNITSPSNNDVFRQPGSVVIQADASDGDPDGSITSVAFYNGNTLLYTDNTSPYFYTWTGVPLGDYSITAVATDNTGNQSTSPSVAFSMLKNSPPVISITSPAENATFLAPATIPIEIAGKDTDDFVEILEIYHDNILLYRFNGLEGDVSTFTYNWTDVGVGDYTLTVKAIDNWGLTAVSAPVHISVTKIPQVITLSSPKANAIFGDPETIYLAINATDIASITKVEYYSDNILVGTSTRYPFHHYWKLVPSGDYTVVAKATDISNLSYVSAPVHLSVVPRTVTRFSLVNAQTDKTLQPLTDGSVLDLGALPTDKLNVRAYTNPNRVGSVVFILDGKKVRTENGGPYALAGDNPSGDYHVWTPSLGYHTLTATPYSKSFGKGTEGISLTIHFTVVNNRTGTITGRENPAVDAEGLRFKIIPNPVMNMLTVFTSGITLNNKVTISIVSSSGTVVRNMIPRGQGQKIQLDISTLAKGTYFLEMVNGNTTMIKPFVKL